MGEPSTYLGASSCHLHCENYKFQSNTPLKVFRRDEICNELTWVDIKGSSGILDSSTFANLPNIENIGFDKCSIEQIDENTFSTLAKLKSVSVRKSTFPLYANVFKNCENLAHIKFIQVDNGINDLLIFKDIKKLEYLLIDHTMGVQLCRDSFSGTENLTNLIIQHCKIETFTEDVFELLTSLESLYMTGNEVRQFSAEALLSLKNLSVLSLYDNSMPSPIDYQIFESLPNLQEFSFPDENIKLLKFEGFKNLKSVNLIDEKNSKETADFLKEKNINFKWTTDSVDLTEDIDFTNPNIMICA